MSEHDWWGKCRMPYYEEVSHIPLIIHDPRVSDFAGRRTHALTQTADLTPTLLGLHDIDVPSEVRANDLTAYLTDDNARGRGVAVFGVFGGPLGITDGAFVLYYYPPDTAAEGLREYTLEPAHMSDFFTIDELKTAELSPGFDFTQGVPVLSYAALPDAKRVPMNDGLGFQDIGTRLFDLRADPAQSRPIEDATVADCLLRQAVGVLHDHDTPGEVFRWYGLDRFLTTKQGVTQ